MSSLNLTPNPIVMAIEAGVFLVNFVVVKKLLLDPYLTVSAKRKQLTEGNQSAAEHLEIENQKSVQKIQSQLNLVADESRALRDQAIENAKIKRDQVVHSASAEATMTIEGMRKELHQELGQERARIPALVDQLTKEFVQKVIPV
jgi:F0F1-type ATP synthase membrane subunit b/b'